MNTKAPEGSGEEQMKEALESENAVNSFNSTCSDATSASNGDVLQPSDGSVGEMVAQRRVSFAR